VGQPHGNAGKVTPLMGRMSTNDRRSHRDGYSRDHLFLSYAGEDCVFAEWIVLNLASAGYHAWYDRDLDNRANIHRFFTAQDAIVNG